MHNISGNDSIENFGLITVALNMYASMRRKIANTGSRQDMIVISGIKMGRDDTNKSMDRISDWRVSETIGVSSFNIFMGLKDC